MQFRMSKLCLDANAMATLSGAIIPTRRERIVTVTTTRQVTTARDVNRSTTIGCGELQLQKVNPTRVKVSIY